MVPRTLILFILAVSALAEFSVPGIYENLTPDVPDYETGSGNYESGSGSGEEPGLDNGNDQDFSVDTDCSNKEDGLYQIAGCSTQFLTCSGGIARIMDCPANLIYDSRIEACEYPNNVPGCISTDAPETTTTTTTPEPETTTEVYVEPTTATDQPSTSPRAAEIRECQEDGFFSYGECSDHYTACSNGRSIPMMCPASLAFDEARQLCDYPLAVPECQGASGQLPSTDESSGDLPYDNGYGYEEPTSSTSADVSSTTEDVPYYPEETTTVQQDETTTEQVPVYPGETTEQELTYPEETTTTEQESGYPEETAPVVPVETISEPANDTPACAEGATEIAPCSDIYNNCVNGNESVFTCENGLKFSSNHGACAPESEIPACQNHEENY
ncbi:unnamed protein product [Caenorhabditis bovis]|uniref:Chitin-binding type-2 domain-containing protein n=1 Tax=Caenorhabditis bovis TaxID=2654633 RepID=A0A8S1EWF6_9PELO|nr:unnamed protein product [Caenorhabditis bovis]